MAFNADARLEALSPPTFTLDGRTWRGRVVSMEEWVRFKPTLEGFNEKTADYFTLRRVVRKLVDFSFPRPWWRFWEHSVAWHVLRLPLPLQLDAVKDFTNSQAAALGLVLHPTPGSASPLAGAAKPRGNRKARRATRSPSGSSLTASSGSTGPSGITAPDSGRRATG